MTTAAAPPRTADLRVSPGVPLPYGATVTPEGINFSIPSGGATSMTLVLYRRGAPEPFAEVVFPRHCRVGGVYSMLVGGLDPEAIEYGYRADGPYAPGRGLRFDARTVLADPYARAFGGRETWGAPYSLDPYPYRSRVVAGDAFDWQGDTSPGIPVEDLVVYELHVRGFTRHPSSGVRRPGTFAGLAEKIPHLLDLGVNCVELLPVFEFDESDNARSSEDRRLFNYWGYNTFGYFAPKAGYAASDDAASELKDTVRRLHAAGIEVVLDVVFNHTAEGDERGRTLSFRGLDNPGFYLLAPDGGYLNFSGTGNTFNANSPVGRAFVLDCLRHWVTEFHIDGFRFDLASALVRGQDGTPLADPPLLEAIAADPVLRDTKLIAEAWDAGGLYQVGSFPHYGRWSEWNGRFRDSARRFLQGDQEAARDLGARVLGSLDLYGRRGPRASVNFITCHDGFTLHDLYAYNDKHNHANGEDNLDGERTNHSWNCGTEGPTDDPEVLRLRSRQVRNALVLLLAGRGVPMLTAGDEFGRSQQGNNNAYCHDELSWVDWDLAADNAGLLNFTRALTAFRHGHPALRSPDARGLAAIPVDGVPLLQWTLRLGDDAVHVAANAHWETHTVPLPDLPGHLAWHAFADTAAPEPLAPA
ncbi:alpha-amylase family glycosyl hydrolase [Streptomyces sp. WELS2]|uniref:glycogen debranching protein n=1 Tax=Streptomyces sp. WELS2 TaxID=2749435 RepID=UPI00286828CD|nr:alpha-amylase family glycosyl hydrolase [Streptomyces sp. WELS2]